MDNNKILELIEAGLLNFYLEDNYRSGKGDVVEEPDPHYSEGQDKYEKMAKQIRFKAKLAANRTSISKIISISEASGRLQELQDKHQGKVFTIFKKHVEEYGLAANFRNFDKMTEDEMRSILQQIDITLLFDEINIELSDE